jgi:toxin ParE1/3/4
MRQFRYSHRADADMVGIAKFSLDRFGEKQTEKYLQQIESAIARAVTLPTLMRARPELGEGIFSVRCVSHVAFLTRPAPDAAWLVVAVLHGGMDPSLHLDPEHDE